MLCHPRKDRGGLLRATAAAAAAYCRCDHDGEQEDHCAATTAMAVAATAKRLAAASKAPTSSESCCTSVMPGSHSQPLIALRFVITDASSGLSSQIQFVRISPTECMAECC